MLEVDCFICGDELNELGAFIFSPPSAWLESERYHLCKRCWELVFDAFIIKMRKQTWRDKKK